ncbi:MAG: TPM domain-containing protein, partial [Clostridia bacterium]|nr:TPM domain-containing protein [Clostridia bacterium]
MKRFLALLTLAVFLASSALASVVQPDDDFYVLDDANVLTQATKAHIIYNNDNLYEACGAQIVFVTIDTFGSMTRDDYAYTLFNEWGIGSAERNNGILVVLAIHDDDGYFLQGPGLERDLPSGDLAELVDEYMMPYFDEGDYDEGCVSLFNALFNRVCSIYDLDLSLTDYTGGTSRDSTSTGYDDGYYYEESHDDWGYSFIDIVIAIIVVFVIISIIMGATRRSGCGCLPSFLGGWIGGSMRRGHRPPPPPGPGPAPRGPRPGGPRPGGRSGGGFGGFGGGG